MSEITTTIRLSAGLRTIAGAKAVTVGINSKAAVRDLLHGLRTVNPSLAKHILTPDGGLVDGMMMLVRGQHIDFQQGLDTLIGPGDDVMIIPPLSGG
ncbi:MAG: MoaD/ThiS family protein [Chloroflexi bacterium]|nr:MoaD/ThiS family protein [Chloroflexota bacterium]